MQLHLNYFFICIDMFVHHITMSAVICLCMLYNTFVGCTSSLIMFPISLLFVLLLYCVNCYICMCINMFVNVISMFPDICWCNSYNILLAWTTYWEAFNSYFLYILFNATIKIFIILHSQKWINIYLFEWFITCIEAHIFAPSLLIYHVFISIVKFFYCILLIGQIKKLMLKHSNTCIQHHIYTIIEKIFRFSYFIFRHT